MNLLYYIVCQDKANTLFEGKFQGRTRGSALKFLKETLNRTTLTGLTYTITEIPVDVIREIVDQRLAELVQATAVAQPKAKTPAKRKAATKQPKAAQPAKAKPKAKAKK
jgi:hypothetical protein